MAEYPGDPSDPYNLHNRNSSQGCDEIGKKLAELGRSPEWRDGQSYGDHQRVMTSWTNSKS